MADEEARRWIENSNTWNATSDIAATNGTASSVPSGVAAFGAEYGDGSGQGYSYEASSHFSSSGGLGEDTYGAEVFSGATVSDGAGLGLAGGATNGFPIGMASSGGYTGGSYESSGYGTELGANYGAFSSGYANAAGSNMNYGSAGQGELYESGSYGSFLTGGRADSSFEGSGYGAASYGATAGSDVSGFNASYGGYGIQRDPNPSIIRRTLQHAPTVYRQNIHVRFLKPPQPPMPGPLIIREVRPPQPPPPPPLVIRQRPSRIRTPPPLILRERPPRPPAILTKKVIVKRLAALPPPPRQVIIERYPPLPPKPRDIIIERWLPYGPMPKRKIIYQRAQGQRAYQAKRNVIVVYEAPQPRVERVFRRLGVSMMNPSSYVTQYGSSLLDSIMLSSTARRYGVVEDITPPGAVLTGGSAGFSSEGYETADIAAGVGGVSTTESSSYAYESSGGAGSYGDAGSSMVAGQEYAYSSSGGAAGGGGFIGGFDSAGYDLGAASNAAGMAAVAGYDVSGAADIASAGGLDGVVNNANALGGLVAGSAGASNQSFYYESGSGSGGAVTSGAMGGGGGYSESGSFSSESLHGGAQ